MTNLVAVFDRVKQPTNTTGTGTLTFDGSTSPPAGFQSFPTAIPSGTVTVPYVIEQGSAWETGTGLYTAAGASGTLTRVVSKSSNSNALLNLTAGAMVYIDPSTATMGYLGVKNKNDVGVAAPDKTIDNTLGYGPGSIIISTTGVWICRSAGTGAAKWEQLTAMQPYARFNPITTNDSSDHNMFVSESMGGLNSFLLPPGHAAMFSAFVMANLGSGSICCAFKVEGAVKNNSGTFNLIGTPTSTAIAIDGGVGAWTVAADTNSGADFVMRVNSGGDTVVWSGHVFLSEN